MRFHLTHRHFTFGMFSLCLILTTLFLGFWQLERLDEKQAYLKTIYRAMSAKPLPLDVLTDQLMVGGDENEKFLYRPVTFEGEILGEKVVTISPRTHQGKAGVYTIVPLRLKTGATILMNLGWSEKPLTFKFPTGQVNLDGLLQLSESGDSIFAADNTPEKNQWHRIDVRALGQHLNLSMNLPLYINLRKGLEHVKVTHQMGDKNPHLAMSAATAYVIPQVQLPAIPNNHLSYAITWFALSFFLAFAYIYYLRQKVFPRKQKRTYRFAS